MAWRDLIWYNFWWKAASLVLALLVWSTVRYGDFSVDARERTGEATRRFDRVPVRVLTDAADLYQYRVVPNTVTVVIRGNPVALARLSERELDVFVNLRDIESAGSLRMRIQAYPPAGLRVDVVAPHDALVEKVPNSDQFPPR